MEMMVVVLVVLFLLLVVWSMWRSREPYLSSSCIITMTTYMGFEDRFQSIQKVLDPLVKTGQEIVVVNEWDENCQRYKDFMRTHYPTVMFVQKSQQDQGQARSLNLLIRDFLMHSPKKYWVHWEDTWVCCRPLFPELFHLMEKNPRVIQLQLTNDWKTMPHSHRGKGLTILQPPPGIQDKSIYELEQLELGEWPLFSLRPSINRLSFFQRHGTDFYFLEHPYLWPLRFEWEFGRIFLRNQGVKAITNQPFAKRLQNHKSTYSDLLAIHDDHSSG